MEPAGLAVGVVSLASLFETCIQLADYISLASNVGRDYETAYTKFLLLKARLYTWRPCLDVLEQSDPNAKGLENMSEEYVLVGRSLAAIKMLLEDAQNLEKSYGLRKEDVSEDILRKPQLGALESIVEIGHALDSSIRQRQQQTSWKRKFFWAIRDKKAFDNLISELSFHINELEKLAARLHMSTTTSIGQSIQNVTSPAALELLESATAEPDLEQSGTYSTGHTFVRNQVAEQARVIFGDLGMAENGGAKHLYIGNQVIGNARVVMGNVSGDVMSGFWGL